jgi:hypothetical protein
MHVRFANYCKEGNEEEMLCCLELKTCNINETTFNASNEFTKKVLKYLQTVQHK